MFDPISFLITLAITVAINVVAYLLTPKSKTPKPEAAKDVQAPTADAGRPIPRVWGTMTVKGINVLYSGEPGSLEHKVKM